ncbi:putative L-ascorbate peroxidase 6 [Morella rubra]|uniref:Putative L-ascorbate peroxidase 6 n=1 Tax=Morella rubra TaxID=262757 RepID=A0A6A1UW27_9ROSI|nr:putative L-ascorbate peroxidase 6 [Morella rubra]
MVLLEIIAGRKNFDATETSEKSHFPSYAFKMLEEGKLRDILDSRVKIDVNDERVLTAIKVALWCIQEDMHLRPSMTKVVQMLEGLCSVPEPPTSSPLGFRMPATSEYLVIKEELRKVLSKGKAAGVLRLVFHDAGTFDMDENSVSSTYCCAGASSLIMWSPTIPVPLGRLDSMKPDPEGKLPEETLDAPGLKQCFQRKGLTTQDLVALSGAHTLGSKGFGNPTVFDNSYFQILLQKPWTSSDGMSRMIGLPSDRALTNDDECSRWIRKYAENQNMFFEDFKDAYLKLVNSGAKWKRL